MTRNINTYFLIALVCFITLRCSSPETKKVSFAVRGNCEMCKERIEETVTKLEGIKSGVWDIETKQLALKFDTTKIKLSQIHNNLASVGHGTSEIEATAEADESLPPCCRKGAKGH